MQTNNDILLILIVIILVLTIIIAVLMWQVQRRRQLLERRREVIERENREAEALLREREQGIGDDIPKFRDIEIEAENPQLTIPFEEEVREVLGDAKRQSRATASLDDTLTAEPIKEDNI